MYKLAEKMKEGIDSVEGVEGVLFQVGLCSCIIRLPSMAGHSRGKKKQGSQLGATLLHPCRIRFPRVKTWI